MRYGGDKMKHMKLNIYGTEVDVYEYKADEVEEVLIGFKKGLVETPILLDGEYIFEGQRVRDSYYGEGTKDGKVVAIFADNINLKQLSNVFLTLGVKNAFAMSAAFVEVREKAKLEGHLAEIESDGATLGENIVINAVTLTEEDIAPKRKPAPKKKARKETPATEE